MDLKNLIVEKEGKRDSVRVPWTEDGNVGFVIAYTGRDVLMKARKKALIRSFNPKSHRIEENLDESRFDFEVLRETLIGWWGLKIKHLKDILDPSRIDLSKLKAEDLEKDVPFNEENRDIIISFYNLNFNNFLTSVATDIEVYRKCKEEELEKNLENFPAGSSKGV